MQSSATYLNLLTNEAGEDRILAFIESNQTALIQGKLGNAFWDSHRSDQRILDWFNSEPVKQLLSKSIR